MNKTYQVGVGLVAVLALVLSLTFGASTSDVEKAAGNIANAVYAKVRQDLQVGATPGPETFDHFTFRSGFTDAGRFVATTTGTGTSATMVARDLLNTEYFKVTLGGALDANFTYTLPATSTLTGLVPFVGAKKEVCWLNVASSTSAHDLIFAAGTGWDLKHSTTTAPVPLGVGDGDEVCIEFIRKPTNSNSLGNITGVLRLLSNSD